MRRILCYGDSNTWGNIPADGRRYPKDVRWTGVASKLLGDEYDIIEEGLNGRTTSFDDYYFDYRNGRKGLGYALCAHAPLDLIVVSLGTNDLKYTNAIGSYKGLDELLRLIEHADACYPAAECRIFPEGTKILVISPIHLYPSINTFRPESSFYGKYDESLKFALYFEQVARLHVAEFLDAAKYSKPSERDCVHMEADSHGALGRAVAKKIRAIFEETPK